jgi:dTDP-glucose 4,6-dehydratase
MRRLLVTGGAGFIGANFVHYWSTMHPADRIVVIDSLTYAGNRANLTALEARPYFRFVTGDICDCARMSQLLRDEAIDTVVHFAAESHVDRSIVASDSFIRTNILGTHSLLEAARALWLEGSQSGRFVSHRFHHVSTDEVYGSLESGDPPFTENSPYRPNSLYAASKAAADLLVQSYHRTYGLEVTISNCSNNYGPFQFPEKLVALTIVSILKGERVSIYGDGLQVRDWLHVSDHCRAIERVLDLGRPGTPYAIGGWAPRTNLEVVHKLCELLDAAFTQQPSLAAIFPKAPPAQGKLSSSLVSHVADRPGHDRRYAIDPERVVSELDFQPEYSFEEGFRHTVSWYLDHGAWWSAILKSQQYKEWITVNYRSRVTDRAVTAYAAASSVPPTRNV